MLWGTNRGKWKRPAAVESRTQDTSGLSRQCSATDHQPPSLTILYVYCTGGTECLSCAPGSMWTFRCNPSIESLVWAWGRVYHSLQHLVSCWLDSYVARSWCRGPAPGPWVLTLEVGEILSQMPFPSKRILHQSHSLLQVVATGHAWFMLIKADFFGWKPLPQ